VDRRESGSLTPPVCDGFYVYILGCADGTFYTGWTNRLAKRLRDHNTPGKGAKYTRSRMPCRLLYYESFDDRESAMKREWEIKHRLSRQQKEELIRGSEKTRGSHK